MSVQKELASPSCPPMRGPEPDSLLTKWKNLSLTKLGQVDNIDFTLESSKGDNMMAEPMTFCLDDFVASIYVTR